VQPYGALRGDAPQYLRQFTPITDIPSRQRLRSSSNDLLVPAVRLSTALAYGWNDLPTGRCHLSTISAHLQKTTKTASVSTFISWPSVINHLFLCAVLVVVACYLNHSFNSLLIDWLIDWCILRLQCWCLDYEFIAVDRLTVLCNSHASPTPNFPC